MMSESEKEEFERIAGNLSGDIPAWPSKPKPSWQHRAATIMLVMCGVGVPVSFALQGVGAAALALMGVVAAYLWRWVSSEDGTEKHQTSIYERAEERWRKRKEGGNE